MPAPLDFADLVLGARTNLGPYNTVQQIAQNKQRLEVLSRWFKEDKVTVRGGTSITRQLMVSDTGAARFCQPTDVDVVNITDILKTMTVPFVHCRDLLDGRSPARSHAAQCRCHRGLHRTAAQRLDALAARHDGNEDLGRGNRQDESDRPLGRLHLAGLRHDEHRLLRWQPLRRRHEGRDHTHLLPNPQAFNNYTDHYSSVSPQDAVSKMRDAHYYTGFVSPIDMKDYTEGAGDNYRIYAQRRVVKGFEDIAMAQGDLGIRDIAVVNGFELVFHMNPIRPVPALDSRTDDPIVMLNHSVFAPQVLEGDYLEETETHSADHHNIMRFHVDLTFNFLCVDPRRNALLVKV
jgi:hypothetical protein